MKRSFFSRLFAKRQASPLVLRAMAVSFIAIVIFDLGACAPAFSPQFASTKKMALPQEPTQDLVPTVAVSPSQSPAIFNVYQLVSATFSANLSTHEISARVQVQSNLGPETVDMLGKIRDDGSASLVDIQPLKGGLYRLAAEAYCVDGTACKKIILNVYYKIGAKTVQRQFVSAALAAVNPATGAQPGGEPKSNGTPAGNNGSASPDTDRPATTSQNQSPPASNAGRDTTEASPSTPNTGAPGSLPNAADGSSPLQTPVVHLDGDGVPTVGDPMSATPASPDADGAADGTEEEDDGDANQGGEYIGSQAPQTVLDQLWVRPEVPTPSQDSTPSSTPAATTTPRRSHPSPPAVTKPKTNAGNQDPTIDDDVPYGFDEPTGASDDADAPTPHATASPRKPSPPPSAGGRTGRAENQTDDDDAVAPPVVAQAQDIPSDAPPTDLEKSLAPLLDLRGGGKAIGYYEHGQLSNAASLSDRPDTLQLVYPDRSTHWGTGMMISLINNATRTMPQWFPDQSVLIGDVAAQHGGRINPHGGQLSHQNGLDIDIPYIGTPGFQSIVVNGHVKPGFQYAKTFQFLRLVHSQTLVIGGRRQTALGRVFVTTPIKAGFCQWAKAHDLLKNPDDVDVLRRMRPFPGHENHFHVRLKCSPHYPLCQLQAEPEPGTGCPP